MIGLDDEGWQGGCRLGGALQYLLIKALCLNRGVDAEILAQNLHHLAEMLNGSMAVTERHVAAHHTLVSRFVVAVLIQALLIDLQRGYQIPVSFIIRPQGEKDA